MPKHLKTLLAASALVAGLAAAPALYADSSDGGSGMMGRSMMGDGHMMEMMGQMSAMMATCNEMMQAVQDEHGGERPNQQWQERSPQDQPQPDSNAG